MYMHLYAFGHLAARTIYMYLELELNLYVFSSELLCICIYMYLAVGVKNSLLSHKLRLQ